ncbi:MAG: ABC transporter permease subunit [Acidobacteria bacterium]|nr:ABC transporter permease subunit [Acidobacteriota bacterium]
MWYGQRSRTVVMGVAFAAFVVCCVLPIAYLLVTTLGAGSSAYAAVLLDSRQRGLLSNTALLGLGTALLATAIGAPLGVALARVPLRRKSAIRLVAAVPILLPPYVVALAWIYLGNSRGLLATILGRDLLSEWTYSLPAAIVILSLVLYPLAMLATELAMRRIDGRLEEAAVIAAPPRRVLWRITLPLIAPTVVAAALIIFVLAVSEFGVPGLLRVRVYTTEVFTAFAALYDFSRAIVLAVPVLVLSVAVAAAAAILLGDRLITARRSIGVSPVVFDAWRRPAEVALLVVVTAAVVLPLVILGHEALAARSLTDVIAGSANAIVRSLALSAVGATVVVALSVWLGYALARTRRAFRLAAQVVLVALFAVPSTIIGVGLIGVWNRSGPAGALYGTDVMFLLAYLARFVPVAVLMLAATAQTISVAQEEAAAVSGAGWSRTIRRIILPQMRFGIAATWVVAFVLAFGELGVSVLVAPPGEATLPIRVYTIIANTPASQVAALALLQALVIFAPVAALGAAASVREAK